MASLRCISIPAASQDEADVLVSLRNQIETLTKVYENRAAAMLDRLLSGASVERGVHKLETETQCKGGQRVTDLVIDGRPCVWK